MKIVVLDGYTLNPGDLTWDAFEALGELSVWDRTDEADIIARIGDAAMVLTNKTPITQRTMDACPGLGYIGVLATGHNIVDVAAANARGIVVTNVPTYGTMAVAQYVFALLLAICHHVEAHSDAVHRGEWSQSKHFSFWNHPLIELEGKTMGIVGFGRIGQQTARIAAAMGMKVLAHSPSRIAEHGAFARQVPLDVLLAQSDVISLHCPLVPDTQGMINRGSIAKMKDGVLFINTARGQLVVEEDLADALNSGKVAAAGIDVVSQEPILPGNPLLSAKNCLLTPHIAWAPKESRARLMRTAAENAREFLRGAPVNAVSAPTTP